MLIKFIAPLVVGALTPSFTAQAAPPRDGLVLHLDAHSVIAPESSTSAKVSIWRDLSGQGHHVQQADAAAQPEVEKTASGEPVIKFDGNDFLDGAPVLPAGTNALTFAAVWQRDDFKGSQVIVEQSAPGNGRRASLLTNEGFYGFNGESNDAHNLLPFKTRQYTVSVLRLQADGTVTLLHNGALKTGRINAAIQNVGADKLRIGGKISGGELLRGAIAEVLVYDRALSDAQLRAVSSDLSRKWGISMDTRDPSKVDYHEILSRTAANPNRYSEPYRPQYHYTPVEGWTNDPNGLTFFNGEWYLFAQHTGTFSQQQAWAQAVSTDLLHWKHLPIAIWPDQHGAIWSGSAVIDEHDTSGFFGGKAGMVCIFTYFDPNQDGRQSQGIAYSADGRNFTTYAKNPVIPQLRYQEGQPDDKDFRDPKVFWYAPTKRWIMAVAGGTLRFYSSPNLRDWTFESINPDIHTECPDFFPMAVDGNAAQTKWVLSGGGRWYRTGSFDGHKFTPDSGEIRFNFGPDAYASQSWDSAPDGRRIMISWMYNFSYQTWPTQPWTGGGMTVPYELNLRQTAAGPRIFQTPIQELKTLRGKAQNWNNQSIAPGTNLLSQVKGKALEIEAEFDISGTAKTFGFKIPAGGGEHTVVGYRPADQKMFVDRRAAGFANIGDYNNLYEAPLPARDKRVKLRLLLDADSVELFGNGGEAIISAKALLDPNRDSIELFADAGEAKLVALKIYPLHSVWRSDEESLALNSKTTKVR